MKTNNSTVEEIKEYPDELMASLQGKMPKTINNMMARFNDIYNYVKQK